MTIITTAKEMVVNGTIYLGIDPGKSGGIAVLYPDGNLGAIKMPETEKDASDFLKELVEYCKAGYSVFAIIEKVHSMPGQGVASTFKFGMNYGFLRGCLISLNIPFNEVTPQKWMSHYLIKRSPTESKTEWKNRLKGKAQQLYPDLKITLQTADALLISRYNLETNGK